MNANAIMLVMVGAAAGLFYSAHRIRVLADREAGR